MPFVLAFSPEPQPTVTPVPDISPVGDYAAALSMIFGAVLLLVAGLVWKRASGWFAEVITDVKATKVQTTNSHETNLRDDLTEALTAIHTLTTTVGEVASDMGEMKVSMRRLDARQTEVHADLRETRKDLRFSTEYVRDVDKRLIEHIDGSHNKEEGRL